MASNKAYLCVQGWGENTSGVEVGALTAGTGVSSIDDANAATNGILGDYSVLNVTGTSAVFTTSLALNPDDSALDGKVTVALLGIRIQPLAQDTVMRATMTVGSTTYESAAAIYGQEMERTLPAGTTGHELFGSGLANIVFHDLPVSVLSSDVEFEIALDAGSLASTTVFIGSVFAGLQIPLQMAPGTFTWSSEPMNDKFTSRAGVNYSSNGVLHRVCSFDVQRANLETLHGIGTDFYTDDIPSPNIFRAMIAAIGQPMLFSPYPYPVTDAAWSGTVSDVDQRLLSVRQNFFSIYGLLDRSSQVTVREEGEGLSQTYRSRMRFGEVR